MSIEAQYNDMMSRCSEDELKEHEELMKLSIPGKIKKAHELLDNIESNLKYIVDSIKAKKK